LRGKIVRKRDDKVSFYSKVHEEYVLLHQTGSTKALTRLFRTALDNYEQHYIYSLLCNDEYGVCKYIKTKDLFTVCKERLNENVLNDIELLSKSFNHYKFVPTGLDLSHSGKFGYVYVLTNPSMPNLIKVGYTCGTVFERARQLSTTSVAHPFKVCYLARVRKPLEVEQEVHVLLDDTRVNASREFFASTVKEAISAIESVATYIPKQGLSVTIK
ncbi:TPA: GIY-YIG nuclease family protein, partial [Vibrio parahaemolyticus]